MTKKGEKQKQLDLKDIKNALNWAFISRKLSGTRSAILRNSIPKVHRPVINDILTYIELRFEKYDNE